VYAAGNFIAASPESPYLQIGEAKYGKPIVDRVLQAQTSLDEAAKCMLISMDSTLRSNISVGLPLDLLVYERGTLRVTRFACLDETSEYLAMIRRTWGEQLRQVFAGIPNPRWTTPAAPPAEDTAPLSFARRHQPVRIGTGNAADLSPAVHQVLAQGTGDGQAQ